MNEMIIGVAGVAFESDSSGLGSVESVSIILADVSAKAAAAFLRLIIPLILVENH
jgi:hypothetical protein